MSINNLKPPIKIPDVLFYRLPIKSVMKPPQAEFIALSTKGDKNWGILRMHKTNIKHREDYTGDILAIDFIKSQEKKKGLGTAMIEFAKNYSRKNGCNGYLILRADSSLADNEIPHLFYRKQNFSTLNNKTDKKMDRFIKRKKVATQKDFSTEIMHYPPKRKKTVSWDFCPNKIILLG